MPQLAMWEQKQFFTRLRSDAKRTLPIEHLSKFHNLLNVLLSLSREQFYIPPLWKCIIWDIWMILQLMVCQALSDFVVLAIYTGLLLENIEYRRKHVTYNKQGRLTSTRQCKKVPMVNVCMFRMINDKTVPALILFLWCEGMPFKPTFALQLGEICNFVVASSKMLPCLYTLF